MTQSTRDTGDDVATCKQILQDTVATLSRIVETIVRHALRDLGYCYDVGALTADVRAKCIALVAKGKKPFKIGSAMGLAPKPQPAQPADLLPVV
jgi:hypothetical protein